MNCCDANGKCTQGFNCPAHECSQAKGRSIEAENWNFPTEEMLPPDTEVRDMAFSFIGFVLCLFVLWAFVSVIAGLLERI